jgi:hypothetical protein
MHIELIKALADLLRSFAWPTTVLLIVIVFRKAIRQRLSSLTEVTYPGGSITMKEVDNLQASLEIKSLPIVEAVASEPLALSFSDPKLVIAQGRIDVERELFRLSWRALGHSEVTQWHTSRHIDELERADVITAQFSQNLRGFVDVANRVIHGADPSSAVVLKTASIAGDLLSTLRYKRLVYEAQRDFEGHGIWHMRRKMGKEDEKFYLMSAVTSQLAEFAYDYDVYRDALGLFNARQQSDKPAAPGGTLPALSLQEFVQTLEWREKELQRLRDDLNRLKWEEHREANMWKWPAGWGDLQWSTSILRERVSIFDAEQDLMQTRAALERHRSRLLTEKRLGTG